MRAEDRLAINVSEYMQRQYPNVIYRLDLAAGGKMSIGMAVRNKRLNPHGGYPDMFIAHPSGGFHGMFIEFKKEGCAITKADGTLRKSPHIERQSLMHGRLRGLGYAAQFCVGFDEAKAAIDRYLNPKQI